MGLIRKDWDLSPQAGDWEKVENKEWEARCMEVYAAMIDTMDQGIGRVVAELKKQGAFDNTLILFLQDNGGCAEAMGRRANVNEKWVERLREPQADGPGRAPAEDLAADADARRPAGARRADGHAGPGGHLHRLRPELGERLQHAVPRVQALGPRRRHLDAADLPLARRHQGPRLALPRARAI